MFSILLGRIQLLCSRRPFSRRHPTSSNIMLMPVRPIRRHLPLRSPLPPWPSWKGHVTVPRRPLVRHHRRMKEKDCPKIRRQMPRYERQMRRGERPRRVFADNSTKAYRGAKYDTAFKKAALELHNNLSDDQKRGKHKFGARAIANKYNETELTSPNDRKINRETLRHWVGKGNAGKTPPKRGRPTFIPDKLPRALVTHAVMMQVSGSGVATGKKMITTGAALLVGTQWEDKICPVNLWRKTRKQNPAILQPVKVKDSEDRRVFNILLSIKHI